MAGGPHRHMKDLNLKTEGRRGRSLRRGVTWSQEEHQWPRGAGLMAGWPAWRCEAQAVVPMGGGQA